MYMMEGIVRWNPLQCRRQFNALYTVGTFKRAVLQFGHAFRQDDAFNLISVIFQGKVGKRAYADGG